MTVDRLVDLLEEERDDTFPAPKGPTTRPDLNAFLLLDKLLPGKTTDIVACAEHDQIWLNVDLEQLAKVATDDDIRSLVFWGVFYSENCLSMFV